MSKGRVLVLSGVVATSLVALACTPAVGGGGGGYSGPTTTTTTTMTVPWQDPTGQFSAFSMTCYFTDPIIGQQHSFAQGASVYVDAPTRVTPGEEFEILVTPGEWAPPVVVQGYWVKDVHGLQMKLPVPAGVEYVDAVLSSGNNMGTGYPNVQLVGNEVVYTVPGPFTPGVMVQMPQIHLKLRVTGNPGGIILTKLNKLTQVAKFEAASVGNSCYPDEDNLFFSVTAITAT